MEKISKSQVKLVKSLQLKKFRDELGLFVAEGEKCVSELSKRFELVHLFREGENATRTEIEQMSGLRTPQGVIGVFKKRDLSTFNFQLSTVVLALDGIQDPGNLGTIIRTCDWFGVHDIICSLDTADCFNPKVVQATMGALARVRVHYVNLPEWLEGIKHQESGIRIYGTLLEGKDMYEVLSAQKSVSPKDDLTATRSYSNAVLQQRGHEVIIMGNEGNGISPEVRPLVTHPIRIPSYPNKKTSDVIESLNVSIATGIVLAEFRRPKTNS
ncbi:MAG: RNA methyltransferase [Paludibacteraceae bacterium]|nr:RNA methyltransferase [Paludibacteraceae bacterium]